MFEIAKNKRTFIEEEEIHNVKSEYQKNEY
jgi:hypothetical protein